MKPEAAIFDNIDQAAEAAADARAIDDIQAGRVVSHGAVRKWLTGFINGEKLPRPRIGE